MSYFAPYRSYYGSQRKPKLGAPSWNVHSQGNGLHFPVRSRSFRKSTKNLINQYGLQKGSTRSIICRIFVFCISNNAAFFILGIMSIDILRDEMVRYIMWSPLNFKRRSQTARDLLIHNNSDGSALKRASEHIGWTLPPEIWRENMWISIKISPSFPQDINDVINISTGLTWILYLMV